MLVTLMVLAFEITSIDESDLSVLILEYTELENKYVILFL